MRNLNLSYNKLNFEGDNASAEASDRFMQNIGEFFELAKFVNHINFSGMNLKSAQLSKIIGWLRCCQFLLGFHLSDNDVTKCKYDPRASDYDYEEAFYECTEEFGVTEEDLVAINRSRKP